MIPSNKSKVPQNFSGDNKRRLIYLMQETIISNMAKALDFLCCQEIYFSTYKDCRKITPVSCKIEAELISNQEEADTKMVLHCCHALSRHSSKKILVRSPSGDTDILAILLTKLLEHQLRPCISRLWKWQTSQRTLASRYRFI